MKWPGLPLKTLWRRRGWPTHCAICNSWGVDVLCEACVASFAQPRTRCRHCALPIAPGVRVCTDCQSQTPLLDFCVASVNYAWPWSEVMVNFKFHAQPAWAHSLALLMRHTPGAELMLESCDVALPVPVSAERLTDRGYNQSALLSQQLAGHKSRPHWLIRSAHTQAQSKLTREQRLHNLDQAFSLSPDAVNNIAGKRLLLIDDVMTTGTTLRQAATVLKNAGAQSVHALVFARA